MFRRLVLLCLLAPVTALAGSATVTWTNPSTNTDGTTIPATGPGSLVSTRVEYGTCANVGAFDGPTQSVTVGQPATSAEISGLASGQWCFAAYAKNTYGTESARSAMASKIVPAANASPTLTNPGNQTTVRGTAVNLQLAASDPEGGVLTYSATGLPTGITLSASTGLFSGSPTTVGTYNVTATVTDDGGLTNSKSFTWTVTNPPIPNPPTIVTVNTVAYLLSNGKKLLAVGDVALGVPCGSFAFSKGKTSYHEIPASAVSNVPPFTSGTFIAECAAV